ncbi:MAG TPA: hypothetical protein VMT61_18225 [Candidatus Binataceae bacterium]|nr:hypothetical protein [Candidatus Binataceae bacterium]
MSATGRTLPGVDAAAVGASAGVLQIAAAADGLAAGVTGALMLIAAVFTGAAGFEGFAAAELLVFEPIAIAASIVRGTGVVEAT